MLFLLRLWQVVSNNLKKKIAQKIYSNSTSLFFIFFFLECLFHKCKLCIVWNWFIAKIILMIQKYLFEAIQYGGKSSGMLRAWREILHQIWVVEKCKPCEIYRRMCDVYREACLSKKRCSRLKQRSVIKVLVVVKCKPCEIYRRMINVYENACFNQRD